MLKLQLKFIIQKEKEQFSSLNYVSTIVNQIDLFTFAVPKLTYGVTGNTSDFGSEESRFEP